VTDTLTQCPRQLETGEPSSDARKQQAKRRRKAAAKFICTFPVNGCRVKSASHPGCGADFTTKHRLESKFSPLLFPYSAPFLNVLILQLAGHIKGCHLGIKDNLCRWCSYATAHPSDLVRHNKLKHTGSRQARKQDQR
jgi:hypothetical protein